MGIKKDVFLKALRKYFPHKTDIRFNRLKRAMAKDPSAQAGSVAAYIHLFAEDKDGNQGPFAEGVRDQHVEEREEYLSDLQVAILSRQKKRTSGDSAAVWVVSAQDCTDAIHEIDPK